MLTSRLRAVARCILLAAVVLSIGAPATDATPTGDASTGESQVTAATSHVRLRKLHLVRPDLIPYPMAHDIYC